MTNILIHPETQNRKRPKDKPSPVKPAGSTIPTLPGIPLPTLPGIPLPLPLGIPGVDEGRLHILSKELQTHVNSSPTRMYHIHIMFINTEMVNKTLPVGHSHLSYPLTYTIPP